jgi:hypothetical protein
VGGDPCPWAACLEPPQEALLPLLLLAAPAAAAPLLPPLLLARVLLHTSAAARAAPPCCRPRRPTPAAHPPAAAAAAGAAQHPLHLLLGPPLLDLPLLLLRGPQGTAADLAHWRVRCGVRCCGVHWGLGGHQQQGTGARLGGDLHRTDTHTHMERVGKVSPRAAQVIFHTP